MFRLSPFTLPNGLLFTLCRDQREAAIARAKAIHESNETAGARDALYARQNSKLVRIVSCIAEEALAGLLGVEPDRTVSPRSAAGGTDWGDIRFRSHTVEVKTRMARDFEHASALDLLVPVWQRDKQVDLYCLTTTIGDWDNYLVQIVGWISRARLLEVAEETDLGHGPTLLVRREYLTTLAEALGKNGDVNSFS